MSEQQPEAVDQLPQGVRAELVIQLTNDGNIKVLYPTSLAMFGILGLLEYAKEVILRQDRLASGQQGPRAKVVMPLPGWPPPPKP